MRAGATRDPLGPGGGLASGLALAVALALGFGLAEVALERIYYSRTFNYYDAADVYWEDQHTLLLYLPHRTLFWTLKPGVRLKATEHVAAPHLKPELARPLRHAWQLRVGPKGFRGPDFEPTKPAAELRVACLGDSRTLGEGLEERDTWPARLEARLLETAGRPVRVLNLGHDGWSSHQGLRLLEERGLGFEPDVAVFFFGVNDTDTDLGMSDRERAPRMDSAFVDVQRALYRSMTFYWAQRQYLALRGALLGKTRVEGWKRARGAPRVARVPPEHFAENLRGFIALARHGGVRPVVVTLPVNPHKDWQDWLSPELSEPALAGVSYATARAHAEAGNLEAAHAELTRLTRATVFGELNRVAARVAAEQGAALADLRATFYEVARHEQLYMDEVHPNARGADLVARAVAGALASGGAPAAAASARPAP